MAAVMLFDLGVDVFTAGGSEKSFVIDAVASFMDSRESSAEGRLEETRKVCSADAVAKFVTANTRDDVDIVADVVSAAEKVLRSPPIKKGKGKKPPANESMSPINKGHHANFRYAVYRILCEKYDYFGLRERIPLPMLAELLVKATFPGDGPADWTCFISASTASISSFNAAAAVEDDSGVGAKRRSSAPLSSSGEVE